MDSKLSMEVIHFYHPYKKYKYMLEEEKVVVQVVSSSFPNKLLIDSLLHRLST
ncbi:hypothetical protein ACQKCU_17160 [Heyndrickxia sporothermodurans]